MNQKVQNIRNDPRYFMRNVLGCDVWDTQADIITSVVNNKRTSVRSCHASGKTYVAARIALKFLMSFSESLVLTTAPTWRQVEQILWREINNAYNKSTVQLPGQLLKTEYNIGDTWFAKGISTDDPDKFQGFHQKYVLVIVDEASGVEPPIYEAIEGILSTGYTRLLLIGNPTDPTGVFANTFKSDLYHKIKISCFDTPNFETFRTLESLIASTEEERNAAMKYPTLISPQFVFERLYEWGEDNPAFVSRCLGEFPLEGDDTLLPLRLVQAAIERAEPEGDDTEILGVDIARFGNDKTCLVYRKGNRVVSIDRFAKQDTMQTVGRVHQFFQQHPYSKIVLDDGGVGGGVTDRLREMKVPITPVNNASRPYNTELYTNIRAEMYWELRRRFEDGTIILPKDDQLLGELTSMKYKYLNGKLTIEKKEDLKKRGLSSPDSADAVCLAFMARKDGWSDFYKEV